MGLDNLEIIVGTYEEFVLGYKLQHADNVYSLSQTFANHSHTGSVRCVTSCGKLLASGGADETVHLYDMEQRKDTGVLMHHNGTVSCIEFSPNGSHLLSGGDDGMVAICRMGSFQLEKVWNTAHKSGVVAISVHPSGKLALSVGADATLRTWNLVKGRQAYASRLGSSKCGAGWQISGVCWSPNGTSYAVGIGSKVDVYSVESATIIYTITTEMKVSSFCFLNNDMLCVGCESGKIYIHEVNKKCCLSETKAHEQRIKCLACVVSMDTFYIFSASSNGQIKLWKYTKKSLLELCNIATGCRITCLTVTTYFSTHVKEEENVSDNFGVLNMEEDELKNYLSEGTVLARPIRKEVVIMEEDGEEQQNETTNFNAKKPNKRKKKKMNHSDTFFEEGEEKLNSGKEKNIHKIKQSIAVSKSIKHKKSKDKKQRNSMGNTWKVSDVKR